MGRVKRDAAHRGPSGETRFTAPPPYAGTATRYAQAKVEIPVWYVCEVPTGHVHVTEATSARRAAETVFGFLHTGDPPETARWVEDFGMRRLVVSKMYRLIVHRKDELPAKGRPSTNRHFDLAVPRGGRRD